MRLAHSFVISECLVVALLFANEGRGQSPSKIVEVEWKAAPRIEKLDPPKISATTVPVSFRGEQGPVQVITPLPAKTALPEPTATLQPIFESSSTGQAYGSPQTLWGSVEYLHWWTKGMNLPPLVTTAPIGGLGTLDNPQTRTLFGNQRANNDPFNGMRVRLGFWLDECGTCGIEAGFFSFGQANDPFQASSNGNPGLFRPFFNTTTNAPDAELVALQLPRAAGGFDPILTGTVAVQNSTDFMGGDVNLRRRLCADECGRIDGLLGYRYMRLRDVTSIQENLLSTDPQEFAAPLNTRINVFDRFETINTFNGAQVGLIGERRFGRWIGSLRTMLAFGVTQQTVKIDGSTQVITPDGTSTVSRGGLLALSSNIGTYNHNAFSVIPEVNLNLGYQITDHIRIFGGYSFLYWSNVVRSSDQINLAVNPTLLPNNGPLAGAPSPVFQRRETDFWAHGFNVGIQMNW